jgi:hypothetical protein
MSYAPSGSNNNNNNDTTIIEKHAIYRPYRLFVGMKSESLCLHCGDRLYENEAGDKICSPVAFL